jgi:hypothetical protein
MISGIVLKALLQICFKGVVRIGDGIAPCSCRVNTGYTFQWEEHH